MELQLPPEIRSYLQELAETYPDIESVWLLGSRANEACTEDSDWDLLVFANRAILNQLRSTFSLRRNHVDLLIVYDDDRFEAPWVEKGYKAPKQGSLKKWEWDVASPDLANYKSIKPIPDDPVRLTIQTLKAIRIWP